MATKHSIRGPLHRATHRIPGVPGHADRPAGHQGTPVHSHDVALQPSLNRRWNHSPTRSAWFMPAWQRRIAALFGQEV